MQSKYHRMIAGLIVFGVSLSGCSAKPTTTAAEKPAKSEPIGDTGLKRITLTQKASERLVIQTASLREEQVTRRRTIGAQVVAAPIGATSGGAGPLWVHMRLNDSDLALFDRDQPVQVFALVGNAQSRADKGASAKLDKGPGGGAENGVNSLYFALNGQDDGFKAGQPVLVDLTLQGGSVMRKVVPYAAVLYDTKGDTWTYISAESLIFVRQKVKVDYIEGDQVYLTEGPAAGTTIVTSGAAELYGTETGVGK